MIWKYTQGNNGNFNEEESGSESNVQMIVDQVLSINDSAAFTLTQENPLWVSDQQPESEDPFKDDFEEDGTSRLVT